MEGAILSCRITLPTDVIFALKRAAALVVTCICFSAMKGAILSCRMIILPSDVIFS